MINIRGICLVVIVILVGCVTVDAQPTTKPTTEGGALLGPKFQSAAAGIAFSPPAGMKEIRGPVGTNEIVRFSSEEKHLELRVTRVILETGKPLPLTTWKDKDGVEHPGMLELTTEQFKTDTPGSQILRQDTTNVGDVSVGMMAARFNYGLETNLLQEAVVRASDQQYFIFAFTCTAPRNGDVSQDPGVQTAVETFSQVLDSLQLLDQTSIKEDQDERLFRTRTLFVNLTRKKLTDTLQKEQWLRVLRDGKDVGYTYVTEEIGRDLPRKGRPERSTGPDGVLIGTRSRVVNDTGGQLDSESWQFVTFDRRYEAWSTVGFTTDPRAGKANFGELGITRWRERPVADQVPQGLGAHPNVSLTEEYRLEVTKLGRNQSATEPIVRDLPPFYLPQAIDHLLPRLIPTREPKGFAFATWVSDAGQLMLRYVDVGTEQEVALNHKRVRAIPIKDRVGLEGPLTTHYMSPEGKYLGSVNEDTHVTILPTDAATLEQLWKNANLTRPGAVEGKE
jgi:hypothetical protein